MSNLESFRNEIDEIDKELVALFEKRMETVIKIAEYKKKNDMAIFNQARELEVIRKNVARLNNKKFEKATKEFLNKVMEISRDIQHEYIEGKVFSLKNDMLIDDEEA